MVSFIFCVVCCTFVLKCCPLCKTPIIDFPIVPIHFSPLKSGQALYSGQINWSQCVLYREERFIVHRMLQELTNVESVHTCVCTDNTW